MEAQRPDGTTRPRAILAPNPSPLTLDGTRTYLVGRRRVAVVDPGPDLPSHLDAVTAAVGDAEVVGILVTHDHPDHADAAPTLARRTGAPIRAAGLGTLRPGDAIPTDAGELHALATPGHTPDHLALHWPAAAAIFVGDLLLGGQDTALVAPPEGDLTAYLDSLARLRALPARVLYPAHGEPFADPAEAIDRYVRHREQRLAQVLRALEQTRPEPATVDRLVDQVYGRGLDPRLRAAAAGATLAYLEHLARAGQVRRAAEGWQRT